MIGPDMAPAHGIPRPSAVELAAAEIEAGGRF